MRIRNALFAAVVISLGYLSATSAQETQPSDPDQLKVAIDIQQTVEPVSKYVFGSFIEHIGPLIYPLASIFAEAFFLIPSRSRPANTAA